MVSFVTFPSCPASSVWRAPSDDFGRHRHTGVTRLNMCGGQTGNGMRTSKRMICSCWCGVFIIILDIWNPSGMMINVSMWLLYLKKRMVQNRQVFVSSISHVFKQLFASSLFDPCPGLEVCCHHPHTCYKRICPSSHQWDGDGEPGICRHQYGLHQRGHCPRCLKLLTWGFWHVTGSEKNGLILDILVEHMFMNAKPFFASRPGFYGPTLRQDLNSLDPNACQYEVEAFFLFFAAFTDHLHPGTRRKWHP